MIYIDLVLDNGQLVRIACPDKHQDALHDSIEHVKIGGWWCPGRWDRTAEYLGHMVDRVNMARVVGRM